MSVLICFPPVATNTLTVKAFAQHEYAPESFGFPPARPS